MGSPEIWLSWHGMTNMQPAIW